MTPDERRARLPGSCFHVSSAWASSSESSMRSLSMMLCALLLGACQRAPEPASLRVEVSHVIDGQPLQLGEGSYRNADGESYSVQRLRYYLSNVRLHGKEGTWVAAPGDPASSLGYHLIDAAKPESQQFEVLGLPAGEYDAVEFLLGIDEVRNHAGAQTGSLDPAQGLFWTWNSGYIFLVFEGRSPASPDRGALTYHLGGGKPSLARTVQLPLAPKPAKLDAKIEPVLHLHADIGALLRGLRFADTPTAMDPAAARPIADSAAGMFRVDHLHHEPRKPAR